MLKRHHTQTSQLFTFPIVLTKNSNTRGDLRPCRFFPSITHRPDSCLFLLISGTTVVGVVGVVRVQLGLYSNQEAALH